MSVGFARGPAVRGSPGGTRPAPIVIAAAVVALGLVGAIVAVAARTGHEIEIAAVALALLGVLLSLRYPLLPLFAFAVLIPFEQAVFIEGVGTISRYAAILFIVAYGLPRLGRLPIRAMPLAGWGYVLWAVFSAGWALDATQSWDHIPTLILLFLVCVLVACVVVDRPTIIRPLLRAYSLAAAATATIGIVTFVLARAPLGATDRVAGLANQDPAFYAAILLPALVFAMDELLHGRWLIPSAVIALLCTIAIVISGTRGAWLSAAVVVPVFILPRLEPARRVAALGVVLALLVITLQIPGISALVSERTGTALSTGGAGRTDIWSLGIRIYGSAPLVGVGLDNFSVALTPELIRDAPVESTTPDTLANLGAHNIVIGTLGELGLVGIVLIGAFLLPLLLRRGWGPDAALVQAALASLLVVALFIDMTARKEFWLLIGIACGLAYLAQREASRQAAHAEQRALEASQRIVPPGYRA